MGRRVITTKQLFAHLVDKEPKGSYDVQRQSFWSGPGSKVESTLEITSKIFLPNILQ